MAGAAPETQGRGVGGDEPVVERRDGRHGQFGAGLGEGLFADVVYELGPLPQMGEEFVEFGLNALAHTAEHDGEERGQRQFAPPDEGVTRFGLASQVANLGGMQEDEKRNEQRR